jgi:ribosomal-protein-serine acetyltransferase
MESSGPRLTDGVVTLRPPIDADAPAISAAVRSSLPELAPFMPWATAEHDDAAALEWIRGVQGPGEVQCLIIGDDGDIAGGCGLNLFNQVNHAANLGYWLRSDRTGRGWATRATVLLAHYGLTQLGLERVEILMSVENEASRRVAERAGATFEGTLRHRLLLHGRYHDAHLFSLIRSDIGSPDGPDAGVVRGGRCGPAPQPAGRVTRTSSTPASTSDGPAPSSASNRIRMV